MALGTFKIDDSQWDRFKAKAGEDGMNASALLKAFIDAYLSARIDISAVKSLEYSRTLDSSVEERLVEAIAEIRAEVGAIAERLGKLKAV